jgi:tetratricopeptide (TPR) repeat protein
MNIKSSVLILAIIFAGSLAFSTHAQGRGEGRTGGGQNMSPEEQTLAKSILAAPDTPAKLKAAAELIKKYPKSAARPRAAQALLEQIRGVTDASQKATLAQEYQKIFDQPAEQEMIMPVLIDAYATANQPDQAFARGAEFLAHNPDAVDVLIDLMSAGTEQAKKMNPKFIPQSLQYGAHAIELIEGDKKPANMDDATWKQYKTTLLPSVYQSVGLLFLVKGDQTQAKARFLKAAELAPSDAFNYVMLAGMVNDEYQKEAKLYQGMPAGKAKDDELKKAQTMLDAVIDAYAHAIAVTEGHANMQQVRSQYQQDLEAYYRYRHNNSTDGLQQLIDKYKVAAKP